MGSNIVKHAFNCTAMTAVGIPAVGSNQFQSLTNFFFNFHFFGRYRSKHFKVLILLKNPCSNYYTKMMRKHDSLGV